jgi:hypothetical protein
MDPPGQENGWGGRIRTSGCENQNLVPYHLATPHQQNGISVTVRDPNSAAGVMATGPERCRVAGKPGKTTDIAGGTSNPAREYPSRVRVSSDQ